MSCLKLYAPVDSDTEDAGFSSPESFEETEPQILSWRHDGPRSSDPSWMELLARTRVIYKNKRCRSCQRPTVEPVEMDNALLNRNRMPIPGSATLVGFQCQYCRDQWRL